MKTVEIYSTPTCHFCHMAKEWFAAHNIPFTNYDVSMDTAKREEMLNKSGQMGVPVIVVGGADIVVGFNKPVLEKLLGVTA